MSKVEILIWSDIRSKTIGIDAYLQKIKDKSLPVNFYKKYVPKPEIIEKIKSKLSNITQNLKILAIGADWCPDCSMNVPRMVKIIQSLDSNKINFQILYGVMVNAMRKKGDIYWHKERSPPEAMDPKFNLEKIPTFFFFIDEKYVGRVVERPVKFSTLEEELLNVLEESFK